MLLTVAGAGAVKNHLWYCSRACEGSVDDFKVLPVVIFPFESIMSLSIGLFDLFGIFGFVIAIRVL